MIAKHNIITLSPRDVRVCAKLIMLISFKVDTLNNHLQPNSTSIIMFRNHNASCGFWFPLCWYLVYEFVLLISSFRPCLCMTTFLGHLFLQWIHSLQKPEIEGFIFCVFIFIILYNGTFFTSKFVLTFCIRLENEKMVLRYLSPNLFLY